MAGHVADDHQLLVVLLAENGGLRLNDVEQLEHDSGDAAEVAGAEFAVKDVLDGWRFDHVFLRLRVEIGFGRDRKSVV